MGFTKEQLIAIENRDSNLLVSAAAGSGKTTVLVERIIGRILDEVHPVDIDRILVMTFTKAAAEQMKDKILKAIEDKKAKEPTNVYLTRQATLVHNAKISTIHGFCLDVIRNHFQEIGLSPDFRVADEGECKLIKQEVFSRVIEAAYEEASDDFIYMTECLMAKKSDTGLENILDKLYEYAMSNPNPEEWLDSCINLYDKTDGDSTSQQPWMKVLIDNAELIIKESYNLANEAYELCVEADGPSAYAAAVERDMEILDELGSLKTYEEYRMKLSSIEFSKLARIKSDDNQIDAAKKDRVKDLRDTYKKSIKDLSDKEFNISLEEHICRMQECTPIVKVLINLTKEIMKDFSLAKRDKNIVDFSDLEHMCIDILAADDGSTAKEYRDYFEEIYVDEYQDSNLVQEELLKYISKGNNLFMVGDVKQSIYSFRLARPKLFMDKYASYSETGVNRRIDLHHNFRSRASVLESVNEIFKQIMSKELGGIEYDDVAALHPGAEYPQVESKYEKTELILIGSDEEIDDKVLEARAIALRIKNLMRDQQVYDGDLKAMRPVKYSDIVILLRSAKGYDEQIRNVLTEEGIPVHVLSSTGYFSAMEVCTLLDMLRILDNPFQDISMAAVLKSVFAGMEDEELAIIHSSCKEKYLYDSIRNYAIAGDSIAIKDKCERFLEKYNEYREKVSYTPVYELLLELIEVEFGTYISAGKNGRKCMMNLNMLLKKAKDYGESSYKGLFHFVKYIEMLRKYEVDYGEANSVDENADTVRIMTIHKSKGLEFPVCIIAGMNKNYNFMDLRTDVIPDVDLGIGISNVDPVLRTKCNTIIQRAISKKQRLEILAEEERVLYVAMTRAKEKLIMTGVVKDIDKSLRQNKSLTKCISYLDLVLHALNTGGMSTVMVNTLTSESIVGDVVREEIRQEVVKEKLYSLLTVKSDEDISCTLEHKLDKAEDYIAGRFGFVYPYQAERAMYEKVSVSELKRRSMHESSEDKELPEQAAELFGSAEQESDCENSIENIADDKAAVNAYIPSFILETKPEISGALHGTAVHRIFEIWDYNLNTERSDIRKFIAKVRSDNLMEEELINCVREDEIYDFINSEIAGRMRKAYCNDKLYREQPFVFNIDNMLVQGIIDAYFIEDGKIVIVDYKTDKVANIEELSDRYHIQLEYYGKALSMMLNMEVGALVIYSTRHKKTINIPFTMIN